MEVFSSDSQQVIQNIKNCIEAFYDNLKNQLEPQTCKTIAESFRHQHIFTEEKANEVARLTEVEVVGVFLDNLLKSSDICRCYSHLLEVLQKLDLQHISDMLEGCNVDNVYMIPWRDALGKHYTKFINEFDPRGILMNTPDLLDTAARQEVAAQPTAVKRSYKFFYYLPKRPDWFSKFIEALRDEENGDLNNWADYLDPDDNLQGKAFQNLITVCSDEIMKTLEPRDIIDHMDSISRASREYVKSKETREQRVRAFINLLTTRIATWYKELIEALLKHKKYSGLVNLLDPSASVKDLPSASQKTMPFEVTRSSTVTGSASGKGSNDGILNDANIMSADSPLSYFAIEPESNKDDKSNNVSQRNEGPIATGGSSETVDSPPPDLNITEKHEGEPNEKKEKTSFPTEVELRDYQKELAGPALRGENCMIVAPTGSGKTYIAVSIGLNHLKEKENAKIIFLVPRVPLVQQQYNLFKRFLGDQASIIFQVTGESGGAVPVHISIEKHSVVVMTAQILVNLLNDNLMKITDISLLIIDECHHAVKKDPYNMIMTIYLDKKLSGESQDKDLPQVVGLTASPGMGKAKKMTQAHENIKTLMANLDITVAPVQVRSATNDLLDFQHEAQDVVIAVPKRYDDRFGDSVKRIMQEIQKCIETDVSKFENVLDGRIKFDLRAVPGSQDYEAWAVTLLNKSKLIHDEEASQYFMTYAQHLREYNNSLMLNDHVRSIDAKDYINDNLFKVRPRNKVEEKVEEIFKRNEPEVDEETNPLLERLKQVLCEEFEKSPNSRCILFVKTRAIAKGLLTYMAENDVLNKLNLNPKQLTGAGARSDNFGMTKVGQEDVLKSFKGGTCKLIVATSVAEEGLDIKECNLIITYNYSNNEVGQVQRKGRGRAKDSKVIMFAYDDSGHVKRERENKIRVELTQKILNELQELDKAKLKSQILKIQHESKKGREFERTVQKYKEKKKKPDTGVFNLNCIWCKKPATTSDKFRHINKQHRVVVDKEFDKRIVIREVPDTSEERLIDDDVDVIGKIYCKNKECGREWGARMRYQDLPISVPAISSFLITNKRGYRAVKQQWKSAPFQVNRELDLSDLESLVN